MASRKRKIISAGAPHTAVSLGHRFGIRLLGVVGNTSRNVGVTLKLT